MIFLWIRLSLSKKYANNTSTDYAIYCLRHSVLRNEVSVLFSKRQRITLRLLYAIGRPSVVCLSVCL